jgi:hypothetical protein
MLSRPGGWADRKAIDSPRFSTHQLAKKQRHRSTSGATLSLDLSLSRATKAQCNLVIAESVGDVDKSSISELTFKDRHKQYGDRA